MDYKKHKNVILIVVSLLLFVFFIYKYMNAGNLTPQEQSNWKNSIEQIAPHVELRLHEAENIRIYATIGSILATFFYGISRTLKSRI
ncbi:hypothetical protein OD350_29410 (plasmid) [Clostridium beijerinckii]|uniref:hypothetical protein n=1 Tax=Clostridium beijerinckii TaxID=1520 RepID=UPI0022265EB4|nr:hypothetical protein [Clostridium beijerinckii]UYZ39008.1 hypothetical protein OD350_29410 [Clostridium beijerinckii]